MSKCLYNSVCHKKYGHQIKPSIYSRASYPYRLLSNGDNTQREELYCVIYTLSGEIASFILKQHIIFFRQLRQYTYMHINIITYHS